MICALCVSETSLTGFDSEIMIQFDGFEVLSVVRYMYLVSVSLYLERLFDNPKFRNAILLISFKKL